MIVKLIEKGTIVSKAIKSKAKDLTPALTEAFTKLGRSAESAMVMANGRGGRPVAPGSLMEAGKALGLSPAAARQFARGRALTEAVVKNIAGLTSKCFAWVPDAAEPLTWQLQIARSDDTGKGWSPDEDLVRAAVAQLPGIAGYGAGLDIPASALPDVNAILRSAWIAANLPLDDPSFAVLNQESLRRAFVDLGLSDSSAILASRGRA